VDSVSSGSDERHHLPWPTSEANAGRPLAGVRVLDLSRVLAGPLCTMVLSDLGADVVKVEPPSGDETRRWGPPFFAEEAVYYYTANRNKWGITLDLKTVRGRLLLQELVAAADVVVENFPADVAKRLTVDFDSLAAANPRLIHLTISGFGPDEPDRRGYDVMVQALGGIMAVTGTADGPPVKVGFPVSDIAAGLYGAIGVLGALRARERSTQPQHIDVALYDVGLSLLANQAMNWLLAGHEPERMGGDHPNVTPYGTYSAKDGFIVLAVGSDAQFQRLLTALDRQHLAADERFATNAARIAHREELRELLQSVLRLSTTDELQSLLDAAEVPSAVVRSVSSALESPEAHNVGSATHPHYGEIRQVMTPIRFDGSYLRPYMAPPELGEHNKVVERD